MYISIHGKKFKKSLKKLEKSGKFKVAELEGVMQKIINRELLEPKYRDHDLTGEYLGCRECHIKNDVLLVYEVDEKNFLITFANIGSHSELF